MGRARVHERPADLRGTHRDRAARGPRRGRGGRRKGRPVRRETIERDRAERGLVVRASAIVSGCSLDGGCRSVALVRVERLAGRSSVEPPRVCVDGVVAVVATREARADRRLTRVLRSRRELRAGLTRDDETAGPPGLDPGPDPMGSLCRSKAAAWPAATAHASATGRVGAARRVRYGRLRRAVKAWPFPKERIGGASAPRAVRTHKDPVAWSGAPHRDTPLGGDHTPRGWRASSGTQAGCEAPKAGPDQPGTTSRSRDASLSTIGPASPQITMSSIRAP